MDVTVKKEPDRYAAYVDGQLAGFTETQRRGDFVIMPHTIVEDRYEGNGVGSKLVKAALDDIRAEGLSVLPLCPFVAAWIRDHPDYTSLVPESERAAFNL